MKALFIPLKSEFFEQFCTGSKTEELRRYGRGWNEKTCAIGRAVTLSKGYGKSSRLNGYIRDFKRQHGSLFGSAHKAAILEVFKTLDVDIACIGIELRPMPDAIDTAQQRGSRPA